MAIQIRRAKLIDFQEIENIERDLEHKLLSSALLKSTLDKENYYYYVAVINNNVVGYIAAEYLIDHLDILAIATHNDYRRQNIATELLNELFSTCIKLEIKDVFLEVRCNNVGAIKFYEKNGFEMISQRKNYYSDTHEDALIYLIKLA